MFDTVLNVFDIIKNRYNLTVKKRETTTEVTGEDLSALWNHEDKNDIQYTFFKKVKFLKSLSIEDTREERNKIIDDYNSKIRKCYNDHRSVIMDSRYPHKYFQPQQTAVKENLVVLVGLGKIAEILTNQSNTFFTFVEIGESNIPVGFLNYKLVLPVYRANVLDLGWFEPHGNSLRIGTGFPQDVRECTIREIGCFDLPTDPSIMLWRVVISDANKYLTHIPGQTYFSISHINWFKGK